MIYLLLTIVLSIIVAMPLARYYSHWIFSMDRWHYVKHLPNFIMELTDRDDFFAQSVLSLWILTDRLEITIDRNKMNYYLQKIKAATIFDLCRKGVTVLTGVN